MRALTARTAQVRLALVAALVVLVAGCSDNPAPDDELNPARAPEIARIVPAQEALAGAQIPTLDPATINDAEIRKAIGAGPRCEFRYTKAGRPVLGVDLRPDGAPAGGIVKVSGSMVPLTPAAVEGAGGPGGTLLLVAEPIRLTVVPDTAEQAEDLDDRRRQEADMVFEIGQDLRTGYRGYLDCMAEPPRKSPRH